MYEIKTTHKPLISTVLGHIFTISMYTHCRIICKWTISIGHVLIRCGKYFIAIAIHTYCRCYCCCSCWAMQEKHKNLWHDKNETTWNNFLKSMQSHEDFVCTIYIYIREALCTRLSSNHWNTLTGIGDCIYCSRSIDSCTMSPLTVIFNIVVWFEFAIHSWYWCFLKLYFTLLSPFPWNFALYPFCFLFVFFSLLQFLAWFCTCVDIQLDSKLKCELLGINTSYDC